MEPQTCEIPQKIQLKMTKVQPPVSVMPWSRPNPFETLKMQDQAAFKEHMLDHLAALDIESPTSPILLSKIICTIGSSSCNFPVIEKMIKYGMAAIRVDMAHLSLSENIQLIRKSRDLINEFSSKYKRVAPIAIIADIRGPEILTGMFHKAEKVLLVEGESVTLTTHPAYDDKGTKGKIFVDHKELANVLKPHDVVLIDYGRIRLEVRGTVDHDIVCDIIRGGEVKSYSDVIVLDVPLNIPSITHKDVIDLEAVVTERVDVVFATAIAGKSSIKAIRSCLGKDNIQGTDILVFAKIESKFEYNKFDEILEEADGIVVNRGKLSVEFSTEKVLQAQKSMAARANKIGKPILLMTEYLNSMIHKNCPTFAEAADVISTVQDGVDGIILRDETAVGEYPDLTVRTLCTLSKEAEALIWQQELWTCLNNAAIPPLDPSQSICIAAVEASLKCHASAIITVTTSGATAKILAKFRPRCPVIGVTRYGKVARQANLWKCIHPLHFIGAPHKSWQIDVDLRLQSAINYGKLCGFIKPGDALILISGWRQGAGLVNNLRMVYASTGDPWVLPFSPVDQ